VAENQTYPTPESLQDVIARQQPQPPYPTAVPGAPPYCTPPVYCAPDVYATSVAYYTPQAVPQATGGNPTQPDTRTFVYVELRPVPTATASVAPPAYPPPTPSDAAWDGLTTAFTVAVVTAVAVLRRVG
jgi:hypothetical protein